MSCATVLGDVSCSTSVSNVDSGLSKARELRRAQIAGQMPTSGMMKSTSRHFTNPSPSFPTFFWTESRINDARAEPFRRPRIIFRKCENYGFQNPASRSDMCPHYDLRLPQPRISGCGRSKTKVGKRQNQELKMPNRGFQSF